MPSFYGPTFWTATAVTPFNGTATAERLYGNFTLVAFVVNLNMTAPTTVQFQVASAPGGPWTNVGSPLTFPANNSILSQKIEERLYANYARAVVANSGGDHVAGEAFFVEGPVTWVP